MSSRESGPLPWRQGDLVIPLWRISGIQTHPSFVRLEVRRGRDRTKIEIAYYDGKTSWAGELVTRFYRVQPAPEASPSAELPALMKAVFSRLKTLEAQPGHVPFVGPASLASETAVDARPPEGAPATWGLPMACAGAVLLALLVHARRKGLGQFRKDALVWSLGGYLAYLSATLVLGRLFPFCSFEMYALMREPMARYVFIADGKRASIRDYRSFYGIEPARLDPPGVVFAAKAESALLHRWIEDHRAAAGDPPGPVPCRLGYVMRSLDADKKLKEDVTILAECSAWPNR